MEARADDVVYYPIWVGGVHLSNKNNNIVDGNGGSAAYTGGITGGTLTLTNYHYEGIGHTDSSATSANCPISAGIFWGGNGELIIHLVGNNVITQTGKGTNDGSEQLYGIFGGNSDNLSIKITATAGGTLTTTGGENAIESYGIGLWLKPLTITGGTITATGGTCNGKSFGFYGNNLTQTGGTFNAIGGDVQGSNSYGIEVWNNGITVSGGELNATGGKARTSHGISINAAGMTVSNGAKCTAKGSYGSYWSYGYSGGTIDVDGGTLICEADSFGTGGSYGVDVSNAVNITNNQASKFTSSGYSQAVTGGQVKNAIAGTGWTNAAGTEGRTEIPVNNEGAVLEFKKLVFPTAAPDQQEQILSFSNESLSLKVGEKGTNTLTGNKTDVTYKSSDVNVATVDQSTGEVTAKSAGGATITATAAENDSYKAATASYTVTVSEDTKDGSSQPSANDGTENTTKLSDQNTGDVVTPASIDPSANTGTYVLNGDHASVTLKKVNTELSNLRIPASFKNEAGEEVKVTDIEPKAFDGAKAKSIDVSKVPLTSLKSNQFSGAKNATVVKLNGKKLKASRISMNAFRNMKKLKTIKLVANKKQFNKLEKKFRKAANKSGSKYKVKIKRVNK